MKFQANKTYTTRSIGDADCIISIKVLRRTAKTLFVEGDQLTNATLRISQFQGVECVSPWGKFSMSPTITAK
jgi:hypothetical protein